MPKRLVVFSIVAALAGLVAAAPAAARDDRLTRGDAMTSLAGMAEASPPGLRINPFVDGLSYCALDWHVIAVRNRDTSYEVPELGVVWDAYAATAETEFAFVLDGVPLATSTYGIRRFEPDAEYLQAFQDYLDNFLGYLGYETILGTSWTQVWGTAVAPQDLAVGAHTLQTSSTVFGELIFEHEVTFQIVEDSLVCSGN